MSGIAGGVAIQAANAYFINEAQRIFAAAQSNNFRAYTQEVPIDGSVLSINALGPNPVVREMTSTQRFAAWRAYARIKQVVPYSQDGIALTATEINGDKSGMIAMAIDNYLSTAPSFWWKPMVDLLVSNPICLDGVALLSTTHPFGSGATTWSNKVTTAFSPATLNTGVVAMRSLKTENGMPFGLSPTHLQVEPTNERDAKDAIGVMRPIPVDSSGVPNAAASVVAAVSQENWLKGELQLIVEPLLTTTTDWQIMDLSKAGCKPLIGGVLTKPEPIISTESSDIYMDSDMIRYALRGRGALMGYVPQTIYGRIG
jgi:hypothetical protein